jgi:SAM-dependent methyltransferase
MDDNVNRETAGRVLRQIAYGAFALLIASLVACANEPRPPSTETPEDINAKFLSEDLDVDEYIERFEGESREIFAERLAIVEALALSEGSQIADIGAGTGFFTALFAKEVGDSGTVYAVEISPKFLEHLRERFATAESTPVRVVEGTRNSVELPPSSVDLVFICDVYHHFESPKETLASLHSAIRPGGSLVLIDFYRIPGESPKWIFEHVRAGEQVFRAEIEAAGFVWTEEIQLEGLQSNYMLRFERIE